MSLDYEMSPRKDHLRSQQLNDRESVNLHYHQQSPTTQCSYQHQQTVRKSLPKRRLSLESTTHKRHKLPSRTASTPSPSPTCITNTELYPKFHLPDGSVYEQTPYGNLRTVVEGNAAVSMVDKSISLETFCGSIQRKQGQCQQQEQPESLEIQKEQVLSVKPSCYQNQHQYQQRQKQQQQHQCHSFQPISMTPSPSLEIESYMIEGYRNDTELKRTSNATVNKSYEEHQVEIAGVNYNLYDQEDEDAHLREDDYEMEM